MCVCVCWGGVVAGGATPSIIHSRGFIQKFWFEVEGASQFYELSFSLHCQEHLLTSAHARARVTVVGSVCVSVCLSVCLSVRGK